MLTRLFAKTGKAIKPVYNKQSILRCFGSQKLGIGDALTVLEDKISEISQLNDIQEYGKVISIGDGIARVFGLSQVQAGEMVKFASGV